MKNVILSAVLALTAFSVPALSFAQSTVTRASVEAQLATLEKAGYSLSGDDANYPADIQAAEAKVAMMPMAMVQRSSAPSEGSSVSGSSATGVAHANANACVGPITFCDTYFGS